MRVGREGSDKGRCGLLVSVVVVLGRQLGCHTHTKTLWCSRQLTGYSSQVGGDGLWGGHAHGCLAIQGGVGVWSLRCGSH